MDWLWTWGGKCFGYREADDLWTHDGRHVGRFDGDDVYASDGRYLGELKGGGRLITNQSRKSRRRSPFTPYVRRVGYVKMVDYVGNVMSLGYEDFPAPEDV